MIWILAKNAWMEQFRNRFYHLILVFGGVLVYASLLLGVLAVEQELRVLEDLGFALMELLLLASVLFAASTSILKEMETKTIYLVLTRPVSRGQYLLGRYLGLMLSVSCAAFLMGAVHLSLLLLRGWEFHFSYGLLLAFCLAKVFMMGALTILLSIFSTSVTTAVLITMILWILGHFMTEIKFLMRKSSGAMYWILAFLNVVIPDLGLLNLKERWLAVQSYFGPAEIFLPLGYSLLYCSVCLALAERLFKKKEF